MAAQQIQIAETIRAMKLALRRQHAASADESSDDAPDLRTHTNRGHKMNARSRFVREGRLDATGGMAYKRKVSHAGYERHIIAKRPKLYDEDGDVVEPHGLPDDADDDAQVYGEPLEEDAFGEVQLEHLLRPLTSAAALPLHPSLSRAYTNKALTQMAQEAADMVRREKASLWNAKRLLERFRGDGGWMACERFETEHDDMLLQTNDEAEGGAHSAVPSITMESLPEFEGAARLENELTMENGVSQALPVPGNEVQGHAGVIEGVFAQDHVDSGERQEPGEEQLSNRHTEANGGATGEAHTNIRDEPVPNEASNSALENPAVTELQQIEASEQESASASAANAPSHAMTTRARARSPQLPASPSPSPSDSASIPAINPWFLTPPSSLPDRDLGLPANEAEETRRLLLLYVQKQENIVRQLSSLYTGLQRVDRLRKELYRACKAEAHLVPNGKGKMVTEMSDGEDWYDPEDWDLQAWELKEGKYLEKGKDEVDDLAEEEGRRVGGRRRRVVGR